VLGVRQHVCIVCCRRQYLRWVAAAGTLYMSWHVTVLWLDDGLYVSLLHPTGRSKLQAPLYCHHTACLV
jgi:hypothetical protein